MAEEQTSSSANEDEFKQGSEPGASRNSMLVATESYEDIAQYLEAELNRADAKNSKTSAAKTQDPTPVETATGKQNDSCQNDKLDNAQEISNDNSNHDARSSQKHDHYNDSTDPIPKNANINDTHKVSDTVATGDSQLVDDSASQVANHPEEICDDISAVNKRLSALSAGDGSPTSIRNEQDFPEQSAEAAPSSPVIEEVMCPELEYVHSHQWKNHEKHIFILSKAGKPIYSRHGDEDRLVTLFGVMQALVSFIQSGKDSVRYMVAGDHKFVFLVREHLILVAITSTGESFTHVLLQLTYVYNQVLSILTLSQLGRIFNMHHNYDLRRLLSGTEKSFDNLLNMMNHDPSFFLGAVRCLPLEASVRDVIAQSIAQNAKVKDLVFAILISHDQLITLVRMKRYFLHPLDLHLIFNLVSASESFKTAESWTPICLPKFDANGYLHAYVSYLDESYHACLLLLTVDKDLFFTLSDCRAKIMEKIKKHHCLKSITDSVKRGTYTISQAGIPELRHFLYKSRSTAQFTSPRFEAPYVTEEDRQRIFRLYQHLHHRIHSSSRPLKIMYTVGEYETLLGWVTSGFELYAVFGPLVTKPLAINSINKLLKWIKKEEDKLFILNSPTF